MSAFTASSNGVSPNSSGSGGAATKPVLETHAWDATFSQAAQLTHSYRGPKMPVPPNRLRIFSGTSNPVRACTLLPSGAVADIVSTLCCQAAVDLCIKSGCDAHCAHAVPETGTWQVKLVK